MRVSINTETRYLLYAALANVLAHLYFTLLVYPLYSDRSMSKTAVLMSVLSALTWVFAIKKKYFNLLLNLVPLLWLICFFHALPSFDALNQAERSDLVIIAPTQHSPLSALMKPSLLLIPMTLLLGYYFCTLSWIQLNRYVSSEYHDGRHKQHKQQKQHEQKSQIAVSINQRSSNHRSSTQQQSLQKVIPKGIKYLPFYWAFVLCISLYFWSDYSPRPNGLEDTQNLVNWLSFIVGFSMLSVFLAFSVVTLRLTPVSYLVLERSNLLKVSDRWRFYVWLILIIALLLMCFESV